MSGHDDLIARATERAEAPAIPEDWGYRVALEEGESFVGRWRGDSTDELNNNRRIHLLWDQDGQRCFSRSYAALDREVDRLAPEVGAAVAIVRGSDYATAKGTGYSFGVETAPCGEPLPDPAAADGDIPF